MSADVAMPAEADAAATLRRQHMRQRFRRHQALVFVLTFLTYTCFHMSRKPYSIVKSTLHPPKYTAIHAHCYKHEKHVATGYPPFNQNGDGVHSGKTLLGMLDSVFLSTYAVSMYFMGHIGDRVNLRWFLCIGMWASALFLFLFGFADAWGIHNYAYFVAVNALGGVFQAIGWPCVVAIMGSWFGRSNRGLLMGIWNAHTSVGNILGAVIATSSLTIDKHKHDWAAAFFVPAAVLAGMGIIDAILLVSDPAEVGFTPERIESLAPPKAVDVDEETNVESGVQQPPSASSPPPSPPPLPPSSSLLSDGVSHDDKLGDHLASEDRAASAASFREMLAIPGVITFAMALFFAKLTAYGFLYWLPLWLEHVGFCQQRAGYFSTLFDVGGVFGGISAGVLSDRTGMHGVTAALFVGGSVPLLWVFYSYSHAHGTSGETGLLCLMSALGFFVNGVYALITTVVSADLGTHPCLQHAHALASVTGFIDGTGSVGAALQGIVIGLLTSDLSWRAVFVMLMCVNSASLLCLARVVRRELGSFMCSSGDGGRRRRHVDGDSCTPILGVVDDSADDVTR